MHCVAHASQHAPPRLAVPVGGGAHGDAPSSAVHADAGAQAATEWIAAVNFGHQVVLDAHATGAGVGVAADVDASVISGADVVDGSNLA